MGGLPFPNFAQIPGQIGGAQGPTYGPQGPGLTNNPNAGAIAPQIMQGLSALLQGLWQGKQAKKQEDMQTVQQGIQMAQAGLPVDYKKWGQAAKAVGLPLDFEGDQRVQQSQQAQPNPQQQLLMGGGGTDKYALMQQGAQGPQLGPGGTPTMMPSAQAPQQPGILSRMLQGMGLQRPQINMSSPGIMGLQRIQQQALERQDALHKLEMGGIDLAELKQNLEKTLGLKWEQMSYEQQMMIADLTKKAVAGDPEAIKIGVVSGILPQTKIGDLMSLAKMMSPPGTSPDQVNQRAGAIAMQAQMMPFTQHLLTLAKDMAPRFGGDPGKAIQYFMGLMNGQPTGLTPSMTPEEKKQIADAASPIMKDLFQRYPTAPSNIIAMAGWAKAQGNEDVLQSLLGVLNKYPTVGSVEQGNWEKRFGFDVTSKAAELNLQRQGLENEMLKTALGAGGDQIKTAMETLRTKGLSDDAYAAAQKQISDITQNLSGLKVKYNGVEVPIYNPLEVITQGSKGSGLSWAFNALNPWGSPDVFLRPNGKATANGKNILDAFKGLGYEGRTAIINGLSVGQRDKQDIVDFINKHLPAAPGFQMSQEEYSEKDMFKNRVSPLPQHEPDEDQDE